MAVKKGTVARKPRAAAKPAAIASSAVVQELKIAETAASAGAETVEAAVKTTTEAATKTVSEVVAATKEQVEKTSKAAFTGYDELSSVNKENLDAVVEAGKIMAKGMEVLSREVMAFTKESIEANTAAATKLFAVSSVQEAIELQSEFARSNFDKAVAETSKLTEMSVKMANEAFEPLQTRMNLTVEKFMKPMTF